MKETPMKLLPLPPLELLNELLEYDPDTGILTWKPREEHHFQDSADTRNPAWTKKWWNGRFAGKTAGVIPKSGYVVVRLNYTNEWGHRLAWKMYHGEDPLYIDHINGIRHDNRIANLRSVTWDDNVKNAKRRRDNISGTTGVGWYAPKSRWRARINDRGLTVTLGYYKTKDEAIAARKAAETVYGYHKNHGRH